MRRGENHVARTYCHISWLLLRMAIKFLVESVGQIASSIQWCLMEAKCRDGRPPAAPYPCHCAGHTSGCCATRGVMLQGGLALRSYITEAVMAWMEPLSAVVSQLTS